MFHSLSELRYWLLYMEMNHTINEVISKLVFESFSPWPSEIVFPCEFEDTSFKKKMNGPWMSMKIPS